MGDTLDSRHRLREGDVPLPSPGQAFRGKDGLCMDSGQWQLPHEVISIRTRLPFLRLVRPAESGSMDKPGRAIATSINQRNLSRQVGRVGMGGLDPPNLRFRTPAFCPLSCVPAGEGQAATRYRPRLSVLRCSARAGYGTPAGRGRRLPGWSRWAGGESWGLSSG